MDKRITIDGIEYNLVPVNKEEIKSDVIEEVKLTGWERVEKGLIYRINEDLGVYDIVKTIYDKDIFSEDLNYFSTESKAQEMADKIELLLAITKWRDENDRDYDDDETGYLILIDNNEANVDYCDIVGIFDVTFTSWQLANQALEIFMDDIKKVWGIE